jgi:8-oxo-dGTP pyrophosphatase MutT (NUDIX family)
MRRFNMWHRSTSIFVIDEHHKFCINKRSKNKDYFPGYLDLAFGGIVSASEIDNVDLAALREAEEEMGIKDLETLKVPGTS